MNLADPKSRGWIKARILAALVLCTAFGCAGTNVAGGPGPLRGSHDGLSPTTAANTRVTGSLAELINLRNSAFEIIIQSLRDANQRRNDPSLSVEERRQAALTIRENISQLVRWQHTFEDNPTAKRLQDSAPPAASAAPP